MEDLISRREAIDDLHGKDPSQSDNIMFVIGDDGIATLYDDTYDITIHCESKEEQDEVKRLLKSMMIHTTSRSIVRAKRNRTK